MWSNKTIDNQAKVDGDMLAWVHVGWDVLCVHTCFIFELPMHLLYFNARLKNSHRALQLIPLLLKSLKPCCSCFSSNCRKSLAVSSRSCHRDFCSVSACCLANMFFLQITTVQLARTLAIRAMLFDILFQVSPQDMCFAVRLGTATTHDG